MYQQALEIDKRIGNEPNVARGYGNLATTYEKLGGHRADAGVSSRKFENPGMHQRPAQCRYIVFQFR